MFDAHAPMWRRMWSLFSVSGAFTVDVWGTALVEHSTCIELVLFACCDEMMPMLPRLCQSKSRVQNDWESWEAHRCNWWARYILSYQTNSYLCEMRNSLNEVLGKRRMLFKPEAMIADGAESKASYQGGRVLIYVKLFSVLHNDEVVLPTHDNRQWSRGTKCKGFYTCAP